MLKPAQICRKCAVLVDLKVVLIYFWALTFCDIHFCIWKFSKFIFMWFLLWSILVCKIPELRRWKLWNPIFALFDSGSIHIKEIRKPTFTFSTVLKTKFAWLHGIRGNFLFFFWSSQKVRSLEPIEKILISLITGEPVSATMSIARLWWSRRFTYLFFILL